MRQSFKDYELIVVDDGSNDGTEKIMESHVNDNINYLRLDKNKGAGAARNFGIENALGEYITFQDSDDEWMPDKLSKQMDLIQQSPMDVGMIYSDMLRFYEDGRRKYFYAPDVKKGIVVNEKNNYQVYGIGQQTTLIKKDCFEKIGLFDTSMPRFIDLEFFIRLTLNYNALRIPEPLVYFYETTGISSNYESLIKARKLLLEKYRDYLKDDNHFKAREYIRIAEAYLKIENFRGAMKYYGKSFRLSPISKSLINSIFKNFFIKNLSHK
jgi:glycosyltransferase involved in cell wall biosynthesis